MTKYGVTPEKESALHKRMAGLGVEETDLEEAFVRGGGPGGQKVNKTASGVHLKHGPTGLEVKCHQARSQGLNRYYARKRLCELLEAQTLGAESPAAKEREKIRKQKQRRKRRSRKKQDEGAADA